MVNLETTIDHLHDQLFHTYEEALGYATGMLSTFTRKELEEKITGFNVVEYDQFKGVLIDRFIVDVELN